MAGQVIRPKHLALKREITWNTLTFKLTLRDKWYKKHQEAKWSRVPVSQNQWHWVSLKKKNSERVLCQAVLLSLECLTRNPRETLPCALGFRAGSVPESLAHISSRTAPACSPASHIQGLRDFWLASCWDFETKALHSQSASTARKSFRVCGYVVRLLHRLGFGTFSCKSFSFFVGLEMWCVQDLFW